VNVAIFIRDTFFACLLGTVACSNTAIANSCSNLNVIGTYDESGLQETQYGINAVGTFRIAGEDDESQQPMFNLAEITCEKSSDGATVSLECKVTMAVVYAQSGKPDPDNPNCSLDLDSAAYSMKELQKGILTGIRNFATGCYNTMLTIDRNAKRIYLSFTRTEYADKYDKIRPGTCGMPPRTQVLMNCTGWPRIRKNGQAPPRYCDFSSSRDK
jgi:hypothetical protein